MSKVKIIKYSILLIWALCFLNIFLPITIILNYLLVFLVLAHLLEFIIFYKKLQDNILHNFILVIIFGYLHIQKIDHEKKTE